MPSNQKQIIVQAKFTYSSLEKAFEKQTKTIENQEEKQVKAIKDNKKQLANTNANYYKNALFFQREENYLRIFKMKDLIK